MDKAFIAQGVANKLYATEGAVDAAIAEASQLLAEIVTARQALGLAATVVNGSTAKVAQTISALSDARTAIVDAHNELAELRDRIGVRVKMNGWQKPPSTAQLPSEAESLRRAG